MKGKIFFLCLLTTAFPPHDWASPFTDLSSRDSDVRARAATLIREGHLYKPPPRERWDKMTSSFAEEESISVVIEILRKNGINTFIVPEDFTSRGVTEISLDEAWKLIFYFSDSKLRDWKLIDNPKEITVSPPANFSGSWHTYRMNGESISHLYIEGRPIVLE